MVDLAAIKECIILCSSKCDQVVIELNLRVANTIGKGDVFGKSDNYLDEKLASSKSNYCDTSQLTSRVVFTSLLTSDQVGPDGKGRKMRSTSMAAVIV